MGCIVFLEHICYSLNVNKNIQRNSYYVSPKIRELIFAL